MQPAKPPTRSVGLGDCLEYYNNCRDISQKMQGIQKNRPCHRQNLQNV